MVNAYTKEDLRLIYRSLPEKLQDIILNPTTIDYYTTVAKKFGLTDAQRILLANQSGLLLMGITQPQRFVLVLKEELNVPREQAAFIAQALNHDVFNGVKDELTKIYSGVLGTVKPTTTVGLAPAPVAPEARQVVPPPPAPATPTGTIFEQKLGGAFRMGGTPPSTPSTPTLVVPPPPRGTIPVPPPPTPAPSSAPKTDPYRETA